MLFVTHGGNFFTSLVVLRTRRLLLCTILLQSHDQRGHLSLKITIKNKLKLNRDLPSILEPWYHTLRLTLEKENSFSLIYFEITR
jgi:hypothetical protein